MVPEVRKNVNNFVHLTPHTRMPPLRVAGATLLGFVGTPWTLAAYAIEGKADKECKETKV
jgi:uroporphyrinogen-III decarboxylase